MIRRIAAIAAITVVVAACGGDDEATPTTVDTNDTTTTTTPVGAEADQAEASNVLRSFMAARRDGSGAEQYLTAEGAEVYPEQIPLYDVATEEVGELRMADASSFEGTVVITTDDGGTRTELIFVGPGEIDGEPVAFAVRGGAIDDTADGSDADAG